MNIPNDSIMPALVYPYGEGISVYNATGVEVAKNRLVFMSGAQGARPRITLASSAAAATTDKALYITTMAIGNGDIGIVVPWAKIGNVNTNGSAAGNPVYLSTAGGWSLTAGAVSRVIGYVLSVSATLGEIFLTTQNSGLLGGGDFLGRVTTTDGVASGIARVVGGQAYVNPTTSGTIQSAGGAPDAEALFNRSISLPAGTLKAGTRLRIRAFINCSDGAGAATAQIRLRLGGLAGIVLADSGAALALATNDYILIDADYVVTAAGAPGAAQGVGQVLNALAAGHTHVATRATGASPITPDTTAALVVGVTGQWSGGAGTDNIELEFLSVDVIG